MKKTNNRRSKQAIDAAPSNADDYEKRVRQLELENKAYQTEVEELRYKLANVPSASGDSRLSSAQKLREDYLQKLTFLEDKVTVLTKKLDAQSQLSTQRRKGDEPTKQLHFEIQRLKAQKVQVQCKIKLESVQFRLYKASMEKEVLQLKKESRKNEHEMQKLLASNERLNKVLHRKTTEAFMATKRLRQLLESRKALLHKKSGARNGNVAAIKLVQGMEHELEDTAQLHELCSQYERQIEEMAEESAKLNDEVEALQQEKLRCICQEKEVDCLEKDLGINDLKEQVVSLSSMVGQLKLHKAEFDHAKKSQDILSQHSVSVGSSSYESAATGASASEDSNDVKAKTASSVCCSCSKNSLCKTMKCKCRSTGGSCRASCGCTASKCSNREAVSIRLNDSPQSETVDGILNCSNSTETEKSSIAASQGAMLLESALVQKPAELSDNLGTRKNSKKPLSEIGNILVIANAAKPGPRKKGRKPPAIRLVTVEVEPTSSLPVNTECIKEAEENAMQAEI